MSRQVTTYLTNDHGRLLSLFREFQTTDPSDLEQRRKNFRRFSRAMERHGRWVGSILLSRLEGRISDEKMGYVEQHLGKEPGRVREDVEDIRVKLKNGETDTSSLEQSLLSTLQDHFSKEENVLYPLFDEHLKEEERSEILDTFDEELRETK